tara:strand:+ start:668 stop:1477 length:810 start_codon:yes stop_codon:yes gene_type:complete
MFENILNNDLDINFKKGSNCYAFEIPNFLSEEQYDLLNQNFPRIEAEEASKINSNFYDTTNQHQLKASLTELDHETYSKYILSNKVLEEFVNTVKSSKFTNFLLKKFYYKILKSRILDPKNFLKFLLRKSRSYTKRNNAFEKFLFNEIYTTVDWVYQFNGAELKPHTDGKKKILTILLYFPDKGLSENQKKSLGTTFFNSNKFNISNNLIENKDQLEDFKKKNDTYTLPFKEKSLFGFIKSHKSWHSVEKFNIDKNFIRKNININLLLV